MTWITNDHAEWAVVGRLRLMLEQTAHEKYSVTQAYALFTAILCWTIQGLRRPNNPISQKLLDKLKKTDIAAEPWRIRVAPTERIEMVGPHRLTVPASANFGSHTIDRVLINLRDATAHGDERNVRAFNANVEGEPTLAGFTFICAELKDPKDRRKKTWEGTITLLEDDMRRIGTALAKMYCDALRRSEAHRKDGQFGADAASIKEVAA